VATRGANPARTAAELSGQSISDAFTCLLGRRGTKVGKTCHRRTYRKRHLLGIMAIMGCTWALLSTQLGQPAWADDTQSSAEEIPSDLTTLSLESLLDIEVITASKKAEKMSDCPAAVFVISKDEIQRFGYRSLSEALQRVIGLYVSSDRNYEYLGVRGFARPGDYNTRVLQLIDGHKLNDPVYDYAMVGEDLPLDIESVERIEVVKGPGSALWGTNALLAVINIVTKKGGDIGYPRMTTEYGSYDRTKLFIEYGNDYRSGLQLSGSFSTLDSKGQQQIYFPEFDDPTTNNGFAEAVDDEEAARGYITASFKGLSFFFNKGRRTKTIPTASWGAVFNSPGTFTTDETTLTELGYEPAVSSSHGGTLLLRVYQDESRYHGTWMYDYGYPTLVANQDYGSSKRWGSEIRYSRDLSSRMSLICGAEYQKAYEMRQLNYDDDPYYTEYLNISESFDLRSYYLQTDLDAGESVRVVAGVRMDDYSTFGQQWSPRAALMYRPSSSGMLKLLYGEAFRAPNDYERSYDIPDVQVGNQELQPEEIATSELVWEQKLGRQSRLVASLFRFDLRNIITQVETDEGLPQFRNAGGVRSEGVELQFESYARNGAIGHLGFSALHARDKTTGEDISNSPKLLISGGISIPVQRGKFYIAPEIKYVGRRRTVSGGHVPSSALANLTITSARRADGLEFSFRIYNLLDEEAYVPGGTEHVQDRIPQDGRTFAFQISRRF
jgi:iron complex outermembrane receptor protein